MGVLAGPFVAAAALLVISGVLKLRRPALTARALTSAGLAPLAPLSRVVGGIEVVAGAGALASSSRALAALAAALYLAFAGFVALAMVRDRPVTDCGCFGTADSPPTVVHLLLDLAAAGVAGAVALGSGGGLARAVDGQPFAGVPFLLLVTVCVAVAYAALTLLPRTLAVAGRD